LPFFDLRASLADVIEVRRDDGELCGYIDAVDGRWRSLTIFGAALGEHADQDDARQHVIDEGLAALAERWTLRDRVTGDDEVVCIQQATPSEVTVALGYYSLAGVPTMTIAVDDLTAGRWRLERRV
jgi:hypothetical protein